MKKAFICSNNNGCTRNLLSKNLFKTFFLKNDWEIVNKPQDADLILFDTCAYTTEREDDCINKITKFLQVKRADAELVVCGCLPSINRKRLANYFTGYSFGPDELNMLEHTIGSKKSISEIPNNYIKMKTSLMMKMRYKTKEGMKWLYHLLGSYFNLNPVTERLFFSGYDQSGYDSSMFYIKIAQGCRNTCTYCAIRYAKGDLKSKPVSAVVDEFRRGISEGYTRFMLVAEDVGCYGTDNSMNLTGLLKEILAVPGDYKLCFNNIHPKWLVLMLDDLIPFLKTGKIDVICAPVQSGSDRILNLMGRGYNIQQFKEAVYTIRRKSPAISIKTHFMVGFPGEIDEDFKASMMLLDELDFDDTAVFEYSSRPGTISSEMKDQIPEPVKRKRYMLLRLKAAFNKRLNKIKLLTKLVSAE